MRDFGWDFLRDEQNREALKILGALLAAIAVAGWTIYREFRAARKLDALTFEVEQIKAAQADILRNIEKTEQRHHDLLFGVMIGKTVATTESVSKNEPPTQPDS